MKRKTIFLGVYLAAALILSYVESLIPMPISIPGMKLGLANLAVIICFYSVVKKEALLINILRIILAGFLFGSMYSILYSLAGGLLSFAIMAVAAKSGLFHITGVSILGGVFHNIGQLLAAYFVVKTVGLFYYFPFLIITGMVTGLLIGILAAKMYGYLNRNRYREE